MAQVPYSPIPSVQSSGPAGGYEDIHATPEMFGGLAGAAERQAGAGLEQTGSNLMGAAIERQNRFNQVAADDAFNKLQAGYFNITYGDPNNPKDTGIYGKRGQDALDAYHPAIQSLDQLRSTISGNLQNDAQRLAFDQASRRLQMFTMDSIGRHVDNQSNVYALAVNKATEANQYQQASASWNDENSFVAGLHKAREGAVKAVQAQFGDNADHALIDKAVTDATSNMIRARAEAWGAHDPSGALDWLTAHEKEVDPNVYPVLKQHLENLGESQDLNARAQGILAGRPLPARGQGQGQPGAPIEPDALDRARAVKEGLENRGLDPATATAFAANALHESSARPDTGPGDNGAAHGVFMWSRERLDAFQKSHNGLLPEQTSLDTQLDFAMNELRGSHSGAMTAIQQADGVEAKARAVSEFYEAPKDVEAEKNRRGATALRLESQLGGGGAAVAAAKPYVVGDSIGVGIQSAGGYEGKTQTAAAPSAILANIQAEPADALRGKPVILSTGVSNRAGEIDLVPQQIDALVAKGVPANQITMVGVGTRPDLVALNTQLARIASDKGVQFSGPLDPAKLAGDQVHLVDYKPLATSLAQPPAEGGGRQATREGLIPGQYLDEAGMVAEAERQAATMSPKAGTELINRVYLGIAHKNALNDRALAAAEKARKDAAEDDGNKIIAQIHKDPTQLDPGAIDASRLDWRQKQDLYRVYQEALNGRENKLYGPGFWQAYQQVHAPQAEPRPPMYQAPRPPGTPPDRSGSAEGLLTQGNIDIANRPVVRNPDGSVSTVRSMSVTLPDGKAALLPTVIGGRVVSDQEAMQHYRQTGENLGIFDNEEHANAYAESLHQQQAQMYAGQPPSRITDPTQLWSRAGPGGDLTLAGVQKLTEEIAAKRTPDGEAESAAKKAFFDGAHAIISRHNPMEPGGGRDPIGEMKFAQFMVLAQKAYTDGKAKGLSYEQLLSPDSKDYIGKVLTVKDSPFVRSPQQMYRDTLQASNPDLPENQEKPAAGKWDLSTKEGVGAAYKAGHYGYGAEAYDAAAADLRKIGTAPPATTAGGPPD